jgi:hypothetical protein
LAWVFVLCVAQRIVFLLFKNKDYRRVKSKKTMCCLCGGYKNHDKKTGSNTLFAVGLGF